MSSTSKLTKHFSWYEATYSSTAAALGISNEPTSAASKGILKAAISMEEVRKVLGDNPVLISSWFRNPQVNAAVGGSPFSSHLTGLAVDFTCPKFGTVTEVCKAIEASDLEFDQLIWEYGVWVHIGFGPAMRRQVMYIKGGSKGYRAGLPK